MEKLTSAIIRECQTRCEELKTIGEYKALGSELRDRFKLSDREAIDLLNGHSELEILAAHE